MIVVVGGEALRHWGLRDATSDVDIWTDENITLQGDVVFMPPHILTLVEQEGGIATIDSLYTIKMSHLGWDVFWWKHLQDVLLLRKNNAKLIPELYTQLVEHWKIEHGNKTYLSLYQGKEEFFNDAVTYIYPHDYLHELASGDQMPIYTEVLKEGQSVAIDYNKFLLLPRDKQIRMFKEEIAVIAAERWLIPPKISGKVDIVKAWQMALHKTVTSLTKNWATEYLLFNIEEWLTPSEHLHNILRKIPEGEKFMAVDLKPFEEIAQLVGISLDELVYCMAEGEGIPVKEEEDFPDRAGRDFKDASYQQELREYHARRRSRKMEFQESLGYENLHQAGGGEGGSEHCEGVFKFKGNTYRAFYSYYSHNGHEYNGIASTLQKVVPIEKVITVYEAQE